MTLLALADAPVDVVSLINDAVAAKNWPLLVVAILMLVVPIVLHLIGKDIPVVSTVLTKIAEFLKARPAPKPEVPSEAPKGVLGVVRVEDETKGPNP